MPRLNKNNYIQTKEKNVWVVKFHYYNNRGLVDLGKVYFPPEWIGKKVSFKVELC